MKVFEVVTEFCRGEDKEITKEYQYVTSERDTLISVVEYFTRHCEEYEKELKSVKEVAVIVQHIKEEAGFKSEAWCAHADKAVILEWTGIGPLCPECNPLEFKFEAHEFIVHGRKP